MPSVNDIQEDWVVREKEIFGEFFATRTELRRTDI
jgi:hypothetical protein